jgi:hypothetical protein
VLLVHSFLTGPPLLSVLSLSTVIFIIIYH